MASIQDLFMGSTQEAKEALRFYEENYSSIGQWILEPSKKITVGNTVDRTCRFCGKHSPEVTFEDEAHAIPESTGNKSLLSAHECDDCNGLFGRGIENDFGNWSKAQRALSGVRGRKGVPTLKEESRQWRFEHNSAGITVSQNESDPIAIVNEPRKEITLTIRRDPYTPVAVLKAFTKMALSVLPEVELRNFHAAMMWIRNGNHNTCLVKTSAFPVLHTFVPGNNPLLNSVILLRRRDNLPVPYMTFVLAYGNEVFQIIVPSPERDTVISGQKIKFPYFPTPYELDRDIKPAAPMRRERIDLTGRSLVRGEMIQTVLRYGDGR